MTKRSKPSGEELRSRTPAPSAVALAVQSPDERREARRQRIAEKQAWLEPCAWCGRAMGLGPQHHQGCGAALAKTDAAAQQWAQATAEDQAAEAALPPEEPWQEAATADLITDGATPEQAAEAVSWAEKLDEQDAAWPDRRQVKPAAELVEGDIVLHGETWRSVLFTEHAEDPNGNVEVLAETTRFDGEEWVTLRWPSYARVTYRRQ